MKRFFVFLFIASVKIWSRLFYRFEVSWVDDSPMADWKQVRVFAFLNHTSLYEPLFLSTMPWSFLWHGSKYALVPIADKTMNRAVIGKMFNLIAPDVVSVSRKKDDTWEGFLHKLSDQTVVCMAPEGRMLRANGLDSNGKPMSVRGGISDILVHIDNGYILFGYSGGLHHVQTPGDLLPRLFKTIRIRYEAVSIQDYKAHLNANSNRELKLAVVKDLEHRKQKHCPWTAPQPYEV